VTPQTFHSATPGVMQQQAGSGCEPLLDSKQAGSLLKIHPKTLQKMARAGTVPAYRIGDLWRFRASTLDSWLGSVVSSIQPLVPLNMKGNNV
jgi:excisionase family DNA binding protein